MLILNKNPKSAQEDLQEIINGLHAYQKHRNSQTKLPLEFPEATKIRGFIPPLVDVSGMGKLSSDNPELYSVILDILQEDLGKVDVKIPEDIIKGMQHIDLKKIYDKLPALIEKKKSTTVRKLANDFPVFENDRLSLIAVVNEVLFLTNEGNVYLMQMKGDVGINVL